uniref:Uncharacterized protein n=1 Tax=Anguilla anguilla TaxID=7936 RepID=A0A0E9R1C9_ANGAN
MAIHLIYVWFWLKAEPAAGITGLCSGLGPQPSVGHAIQLLIVIM